MSLKMAFMGTPEFSVPTLKALINSDHDVVAVYTQPPRKSGRGQKVQRSPVHNAAAENGIVVRTPLNFKGPEDIAEFNALELDVAIVVAYGLLLPKTILDAPRLGCLNIHASLLPRWRGAAPIQRSIMAGDKETGVMVMQMEEGLDTGPVLGADRVKIEDRETGATLHNKLALLGGPLVLKTLAEIEKGKAQALLQEEQGALYARKVSKQESQIDWNQGVDEIDRRIRGLSPNPGAWTALPGTTDRLKILQASAVEGLGQAGEVLSPPLIIACGDGALKIESVQRSGKAPCSAVEFIRGFDLPIGTTLPGPTRQ